MPWRDPRDIERVWTPDQKFVWEKFVFTVPAHCTEQQVQDAADKYKRKAGAALEFQGFTVLGFEGPEVNRGVVAQGTTPPDRRPYVLYAKVTRRPQTIRVDVPDEDIAIYQKAGFKLV